MMAVVSRVRADAMFGVACAMSGRRRMKEQMRIR